MIELSPRLAVISKHITRHQTMADIGCDHGLLSVYMILKGLVPKAIAMDLRPAPLEKARACIKKYQLEGQIDIRLSDGLKSLKPSEAETAVIAGMGGILIKDILDREENVFLKTKKLILQPMNNGHILRHFLIHHGYQIECELLAKEDRRFYEIMVVTQGKTNLSLPIEYEIGLIHKTKDKDLLLQKIKALICSDKILLERLERHNSAIAKQRKSEISKHIQNLLKAREVIENSRNI
ncbi:MAG: SAM-dependent methyltransferase [Eubacteriaceae bacterium]|nr:SAM-dependent methyltransferase [Eubacteriaceae bacterium]